MGRGLCLFLRRGKNASDKHGGGGLFVPCDTSCVIGQDQRVSVREFLE